MRETIDGAVFRAMMLSAASALNANKRQINELNVFPVPDGDTGTNMGLTLSTAAAELRKLTGLSLTKAADTAALSLLRGARGNSGVILSLLFRGISKNLKGKAEANAIEFASAMAEGVDAAYKAVMKPAEGTILTVSRAAARAAVEFAENGSDLELMLVYTLESAKAALAETVNQNPVLKRAGVIDAGGKGYVIMLEAMLAAMQGREVEGAPEDAEGEAPLNERADFGSFDTEEITYSYCTEFIVERVGNRSADLLRAFVDSIGDSAVVVDDEELIKVHVHTNEPGRVLTEALLYGSLLTVKIENMREQHSSLSQLKPESASAERAVAAPEKKLGAVAVCSGEGLSALFKNVGADRVVTGGQTMNPSTEDILREIDQTPAETVFVLPNNKNIIMAAQQCAPLTEKRVVVIPTGSVPQGVTALLSLEADGDADECERAMLAAVANVHTALVTYAARDSEFDGHSIQAGEYLALLDGALLGSFTELSLLIEALAEALDVYEPEFITLYYGEDVSEEQATRTGDELGGHFDEAEISVINGGQPVYSYMISAE